jgi:polyhydroxyalkanoate synthase
MSNPLLDLVLDTQQKLVTETFKMWDRLSAMPKVPRAAMKVQVGITPNDVVYEESSLKLLRYRNPKPIVHQQPIVICYALVNRPYILDLQPSRSVVAQLLNQGFNVYLIDWGVPTAADRTMRLYDYVCGLMRHVGDFVREDAGSDQFHLFGYCMGGTMSTMYTTLYPELVRTLTLLAAPIDFAVEGLLNLWTQEKYFDVDRLVDAYGNCPPDLLQGAFQLMKPVQNFVEKYTSFYENMHDDKFLDSFFAMEHWGQDNIPVAGETFREFVKYLYQRNQLVKGEFHLRHDVPIKLERLTCPLLLLTADFDHLVPPAATLGIEPHVRSPEVAKMAIHAGHVGLAVSSKAHRSFWPQAASWIAERSEPVRKRGLSP